MINDFAELEKLLGIAAQRGEAILGLCKQLENMYKFAAMRDNGDLYVYDKTLGYSVLEGKITIETELQKYCPRISNDAVSAIIEKIRMRNPVDRRKFDADHIWLHVDNGWLNIITKEFAEHSPDRYSFSKIPHIYDPEATNLKQQEFFKAVFEAEDLDAVQKFFGYLLLPDNRYKKAFIGVGPKDTGKSKFAELVEVFAGVVSHVSLHDMAANNHNVVTITRSIVNTTSELAKYKLKDVSLFKAITGGDERTYREIFGKPFSAIVRAKFLMVSNELPDFDGMDQTFIDRWIVFRFSNVFKQGEDMDVNIMEKLTTSSEMSGLLNYAIEGLAKLEKDRYFKNEDYSELKNRWEAISSKIRDYKEKWLKSNKDSKILASELYQHYRENAKGELSDAMFGRELKKLGIIHKQARVNGKKRWIYEGISVEGVPGVPGNFSIDEYSPDDNTEE
jgi:P4 family phage/plasmid primase-like protien